MISTKKEVKRRTGKLSGDITAEEVLEAMEHGFGQRDDSVQITKDSRIMPLFLGYKVSAKEREDICGIVTFNQKEKKCEISSVCIGVNENTVWTVHFGDSFYSLYEMEEKSPKISEIDDVLASRLDDCELIFYTFYDALLFNLEHHNFTDLTEEAYGWFMEEIKQEKNARRIIIDLFALTLFFENAVDDYPLLFIPQFTACLLRILYESFVYQMPKSKQISSLVAWAKTLQAGMENSNQMIRKFEKAVKGSIFYAYFLAAFKGFGRVLDGFDEIDFETECSAEELLNALEEGMNNEAKELMKTMEERYDLILQNVLAAKKGIHPELFWGYFK